MNQKDMFEFFEGFAVMHNLNHSDKDCIFISHSLNEFHGYCTILFYGGSEVAAVQSDGMLKFSFGKGFHYKKKEEFRTSLMNKGYKLKEDNLYDLTLDQMIDVMSNHAVKLFS